ncbi:MAG: TetR/AcrR family transcriptional regulator [Candidatus Thorarchaeota archaeon]
MQLKKEKIKKRIEDAAREDFLMHGYSKTSMRKIAKKARISTSNIYNYFKGKDYLFYSLIDPVFEKIKSLLSHLFETEEKLGEFEFFRRISDVVAHPVGEIIKKNAKELIILMDKSEGTKYTNFKEDLVKIIESHFMESIVHEKKVRDKNLANSFVIHIISNNFLEGLLELAKHYQNDEWVDVNIDLLMKYHINGISGLLN